jgi:hypothetical protein
VRDVHFPNSNNGREKIDAENGDKEGVLRYSTDSVVLTVRGPTFSFTDSDTIQAVTSEYLDADWIVHLGMNELTDNFTPETVRNNAGRLPQGCKWLGVLSDGNTAKFI